MKRLARGLENYHEHCGSFPPAAVWSTEATRSIALHSTARIDLVTHQNWAQFLLPFIGEEDVAGRFSDDRPMGDPLNEQARTARLAVMSCPDDTYNRRNNHYEFTADGSIEERILFARGNYAVNGGTQSLPLEGPTTTTPLGDYTRLVMQEAPRKYQLWGNGIAGINRSFSLEQFENGRSSTVALDEVRAGIHPRDPRGVWALGQIGGSITWAHGVGGDAYGPNNRWPRSDDILGCRNLHSLLGEEALVAEGMPCVSYVNANRQATARSLHPNGAHVAFLDGSVRLIRNEIDPGIWHVIHSRQTPAAKLAGRFEELLETSGFHKEQQHPAPNAPPDRSDGSIQHASLRSDSSSLTNSVGMTFSLIRAGVFEMGTPDKRNPLDTTGQCPAHTVEITKSFLLGTHEVTQKQYAQVMEAPPQAVSEREESAASQDDYPVVNVTWYEAEEFCRRLSAMPEERMAGRRYRLPTEAEWEYACRERESRPYLWRSTRRKEDRSGEAAGITPSLPLTDVGSYPPNKLGLYDMRGNSWEWTADWFDRDYYARSPREDPKGPAAGFLKVVRGGDWRFVGEICHLDYPMMPPWTDNPMVGFRVVCEIESETPEEN